MTEDLEVPPAVEQPEEPVKAPLIESRFLFVDVAALRAKQLRRGALPRLEELKQEEVEFRTDVLRKPERIAMEEVRRGLVWYDMPVPPPPVVEGDS